MRKHHVITPFSRDGMQGIYADLFSRWKDSVTWHPVYHDWRLKFPSLFWIKPLYCGPVPGGITPGCSNSGFFPAGDVDPCYWKLNFFINTQELIDEHRYLFMPDDDLLPSGFFEQTDRHSGEVILCSSNRGQHQPPGDRKHPCSVLFACPENTRLAWVGLTQVILSGRVLRGRQFMTNFSGADGRFIEALAKEFPIDYADEVFVWFNYFEPGRWDAAL